MKSNENIGQTPSSITQNDRISMRNCALLCRFTTTTGWIAVNAMQLWKKNGNRDEKIQQQKKMEQKTHTHLCAKFCTSVVFLLFGRIKLPECSEVVRCAMCMTEKTTTHHTIKMHTIDMLTLNHYLTWLFTFGFYVVSFRFVQFFFLRVCNWTIFLTNAFNLLLNQFLLRIFIPLGKFHSCCHLWSLFKRSVSIQCTECTVAFAINTLNEKRACERARDCKEEWMSKMLY